MNNETLSSLCKLIAENRSMTPSPIRCLILACGNTLRSDDGIGPWLAAWMGERFADDPRVSVISRQQWTPDLAREIAQAETVLFLDSSIDSAPGQVRIREVCPASAAEGLATHHQGAAELLGLALELYGAQPKSAQLLTIGAGSVQLGEEFSEAVLDSIPKACTLLAGRVAQMLGEDHRR